MVDFRYHLVSLISVFLALAVGIVLGAGPLKEPITGTLTNEVEQLRTERNQLRADLAQTQQENSTLDAYLSEVSDQVLANLLPERKVAVLSVDQSNTNVHDSVTARLAQAGATVAVDLQLTDVWWSESHAKENEALAKKLREEVTSLPRGSTTATLAGALWFGLTDATSSGQTTSEATAVLGMLEKAGLIDTNGLSTPVDSSVVYIDQSLVETATDQTPATADADAISTLCTELARAAALTTDGTVFGGPAQTTVDPTTVVRNSTSLSSMVSTVDDITDVMGQISVPRALASDIEGHTGHYGTAGGDSPGRATDGLAPGYSPVPTPTPSASETANPPAADPASNTDAEGAGHANATPSPGEANG